MLFLVYAELGNGSDVGVNDDVKDDGWPLVENPRVPLGYCDGSLQQVHLIPEVVPRRTLVVKTPVMESSGELV